jgi:hypothetical protein
VRQGVADIAGRSSRSSNQMGRSTQPGLRRFTSATLSPGEYVSPGVRW